MGLLPPRFPLEASWPALRTYRSPVGEGGHVLGDDEAAPADGPGAEDAFAPPLDSARLILFFRTCEARNTRTLRGRMGTSSPVLGLRPIRCPFWRTEKLPKDEIFTVSPRVSDSTISLRMVSTRAAESFRDRPTSWYTASLRSARVTVVSDMAFPPRSCATAEWTGLAHDRFV